MDILISWFEIPAFDLDRAKAFYQQILGVAFRDETIGGSLLAVFPYDRQAATGGCIIQGEGYQPGQNGAVVYLNAGDALAPVLARVAAAGGRILTPTTPLPPGMGACAHISDTEGDRIGLHGAR